MKNEPPIPATAFSEQDLETLDAWLLRRRIGLADAVTLEGFLTAIVIGPHLVSPTTWLPKVWGGKAPPFKDLAELNRFVALVMGYYNDVAACFAADPSRFEPTFYASEIEGRTLLIVDEWCEGFIKGTRLDTPGWKPLQRERPDLLRPIELFGTRAGWRELAAGGEAELHAIWSVRVAPAVRDIHAYWLPYRSARRAGPAPDRHH